MADNMPDPVQRVRHLPATIQGPLVPGYTYVRDLNAAGQSYNNYLNSVVTELGRQRDAIQQALDTYQKQEQHAAEQLKGTTSRHA